MSFFDLFDLDPQKVVEFLAKLHINVSVEMVDTVITILILIALVFALVTGVSWVWKKWDAILTFFSKTRK